MKVKILVLILVLLLIPGSLLIPGIIVAAVGTASAAVITETQFIDCVTATGNIESLEDAQLYLDTVVVADQVYVSVGDYVNKGQVIADINVDKSKAVMAQNPFSGIDKKIDLPPELDDVLGVFGALSGLSEAELSQAFSTFQQSGGTSLTTDLEVPCQLTAPMSGIVGDLNLKEGTPTEVGEAAISVVDNTKLALRVSVNESQIQKVSHGDQVKISGSGFSGRNYKGTVIKIFPIASKNKGSLLSESTVEVLIEIENPDEYLMSGFTAKAEILTDVREHVLVVPYEAVEQDENNKEYVYLYENGRAYKRYIETGEEMQEGLEIRSGLGLGDIVIENNASIKKNGQYVRIS